MSVEATRGPVKGAGRWVRETSDRKVSRNQPPSGCRSSPRRSIQYWADLTPRPDRRRGGAANRTGDVALAGRSRRRTCECGRSSPAEGLLRGGSVLRRAVAGLSAGIGAAGGSVHFCAEVVRAQPLPTVPDLEAREDVGEVEARAEVAAVLHRVVDEV